MQKRFFLLGSFLVGILCQIPIVSAQSGGATAPLATVYVVQQTADTFSFVGVPTSTPIVSYTWDFGDNTTASGAVVTHRYAVAGSHQVLLTVVDSSNRTG